MKNTGHTFFYWCEVNWEVFIVSLREGRRPAKQSNYLNIILVSIGLFMILALGLSTAALAQEQNIKKTDEIKPAAKPQATKEAPVKKEATEERTVSVPKEIEGKVSGISPNFIAIAYGESKQASLEMAFDLNKNVKVNHKKSLSEIAMGDTVKVDYDEITRTRDDGKKISRRAAKMVTFLRKAEKIPEAAEPEVSSDIEEQSAEESLSLPIKGVRQE